ncbi:hypothetical protein [Halosolutus gelatinilyticus]|uniref:hypothetical protein n=1 Tax=Halosolutus gelatinilyticus TaxID=2931975 RepID=UPI001FF531D0|nr:hypothetical protein [Halosolutus gelatinilyticus]
MTRFQRRATLILGIGLLASVFGFVAFAGIDGLRPSTISGAVLLAGAGAADVASYARDEYRIAGRTVRWRHLYAVGTGLLAIGLVVTTLPTIDSTPGLGVATLLGASSLLFFSYQALVDGPHLDLDAEPSKTRLLVVALAAIGCVGLGAVATIVLS